MGRFPSGWGMLVLLTAPVWAQQAAAPSGPTGGVTGYVWCGDTRGPGRLASVMLQPVVVAEALPKAKGSAGGSTIDQTPTGVVQTSIDGSFTIANVTPGDYYVMAELPGYISPISALTREQMNTPRRRRPR